MIIYMIVINVLTFCVYGLDKWKAIQGKWRTPEKVLLGLALIGGSLGALLGMEIFRHKTKHLSFRIFVPICLILHVLLIWL